MASGSESSSMVCGYKAVGRANLLCIACGREQLVLGVAVAMGLPDTTMPVGVPKCR